MSDEPSHQDHTESAPAAGITIALADEPIAQMQSFVGFEGAPFKDMIDAFRFAVSLALAIKQGQPPVLQNRPSQTKYNIGTFDSEQIFREAFQIVAPDAVQVTPLTKLIRAYGEWGIDLMNEEMMASGGEFSIAQMINKTRTRVEETAEERV